MRREDEEFAVADNPRYIKERMLGQPRTDIERAAAHFGIYPEEVTGWHLAQLPLRGAGLVRGTAAQYVGSPQYSTTQLLGTVAVAGGAGLLNYYVAKSMYQGVTPAKYLGAGVIGVGIALVAGTIVRGILASEA